MVVIALLTSPLFLLPPHQHRQPPPIDEELGADFRQQSFNLALVASRDGGTAVALASTIRCLREGALRRLTRFHCSQVGKEEHGATAEGAEEELEEDG